MSMRAKSRATRHWTPAIRLIFAGFLLLLTMPGPVSARAPLVTDLSSHLISVTSSFTGTDLLLFGTVDVREEPGRRADIIVSVRGPDAPLVVRRKERVAGIWVNTDAVEFSRIPGFYAVAANRPLGEIAPAKILKRMQIGTANLRLFPTDRADAKIATDFAKAIRRNRLDSGLYSATRTPVNFLGESLFRTRIHFPANVPVGNYTAEVYLFQGGELVSAQSMPLFIKKFGIERMIFHIAQTQPFLYGIAAIILALLGGWLAAVVFRRD